MDFDQGGIPKIGTVIRGKAPATSMSYHEDGGHLYVASESDSRLRVVDCQLGTSERPAVRFEKDGVRMVEATHHNQCLLYTGKGDKTDTVGERHAIHYFSLHDNKILRNFRGHSNDVTDLSMSPVDDNFLSCSSDRTVRLWNLQQAGALGEMTLPKTGGGNKVSLDTNGTPHACYDSTGLVFGITAPLTGGAGNLIHLYDSRNYGNGAFADFEVDQSNIKKAIQSKVLSSNIATELSFAKWTGMEFDVSGKKILITTEKGVVFVVDGYDGTVRNAFVAETVNSSTTPSEPMAACFARDDKTVLCANEDGSIHCYDVNTDVMMKKLQGHVGRVGCMAANPKYAQFASACTNTAIWLW